jgi:hypothetical protein
LKVIIVNKSDKIKQNNHNIKEQLN